MNTTNWYRKQNNYFYKWRTNCHKKNQTKCLVRTSKYWQIESDAQNVIQILSRPLGRRREGTERPLPAMSPRAFSKRHVEIKGYEEGECIVANRLWRSALRLVSVSARVLVWIGILADVRHFREQCVTVCCTGRLQSTSRDFLQFCELHYYWTAHRRKIVVYIWDLISKGTFDANLYDDRSYGDILGLLLPWLCA